MLACDVMTPDVATVREDASASQAIALMEARRCSGLPVVDAQDVLVGVLTEGDLLRRVETGTAGQARAGWLDRLFGAGGGAADYVRTRSRRVGDLMTRDVATVAERTPLEDVVALMQRRRVKRVPVVRDGVVVGVISRADLVRVLGRALKDEAAGAPPDDLIRDKLQAELRAQDWFPAHEVSVAVKDGVVTLRGIIRDERARAALRVAAQNVAGVAAVEDKLTWVDPAGAGLVF